MKHTDYTIALHRTDTACPFLTAIPSNDKTVLEFSLECSFAGTFSIGEKCKAYDLISCRTLHYCLPVSNKSSVRLIFEDPNYYIDLIPSYNNEFYQAHLYDNGMHHDVFSYMYVNEK